MKDRESWEITFGCEYHSNKLENVGLDALIFKLRIVYAIKQQTNERAIWINCQVLGIDDGN